MNNNNMRAERHQTHFSLSRTDILYLKTKFTVFQKRSECFNEMKDSLINCMKYILQALHWLPIPKMKHFKTFSKFT